MSFIREIAARYVQAWLEQREPAPTLDRTRPEGAYVTQILPDELSAAAGQRPRYKLERVAGDCTVGEITVTEDEARSLAGRLGGYLGPAALTREQVLAMTYPAYQSRFCLGMLSGVGIVILTFIGLELLKR